MARMKSVLWILVVAFAAPCCAQNACSPGAIPAAGARVQAVVAELRKNQLAEDAMETNVPPAIADQMTRLKDALSAASDAALACEQPSVDVSRLRKSLILALHATQPMPEDPNTLSKDDPRYKEDDGAYGHNLHVEARRPVGFAGLLEVQYSINIECGVDTMLLIYELHDGNWKQRLRWQAQPLKEISDAFGDFFVSKILTGGRSTEGSASNWRLAVAHGTAWCTSRFTDFKMDLLAPGMSPASPQVIWHIDRDYSRGGDFEPILKSVANVFELRVNADCMDMDAVNCFERRVIYRYEVDADDHVRRIGPMGLNARGFVHEWLASPWEESENLTVAEARVELHKVHDGFDPQRKADGSEYYSNRYGPVRACSYSGVFQVEIDSALEIIAPGKSDGESKRLPSHYFHVREGKDGYVMVSAPTEPDPACTGPDLMPAAGGSI